MEEGGCRFGETVCGFIEFKYENEQNIANFAIDHNGPDLELKGGI
ncbi:MAG: hypothetical protein QW062_05250 [Thermoplasmatales archaeon]